MKRALALLVGLACAGSVLAAEPPRPPTEAAQALTTAPLGRLFFTPAERAQLDMARLRKPAPAAPTPEVAEAPPPAPLPQIVSYGGIVRRSDGKAMLWLNNRLVDEKEALAGLNLKGRVRPDGAVTLQVPDSPGSIDVKVGQSVELHTGRIAEGRPKLPENKPREEDAADAKADGKGAPNPAGAPNAAGNAPAKAAETPSPERTVSAPGTVGLKLDTGGRALDSGKK